MGSIGHHHRAIRKEQRLQDVDAPCRIAEQQFTIGGPQGVAIAVEVLTVEVGLGGVVARIAPEHVPAAVGIGDGPHGTLLVRRVAHHHGIGRIGAPLGCGAVGGGHQQGQQKGHTKADPDGELCQAVNEFLAVHDGSCVHVDHVVRHCDPESRTAFACEKGTPSKRSGGRGSGHPASAFSTSSFFLLLISTRALFFSTTCPSSRWVIAERFTREERCTRRKPSGASMSS